jgi:hypothetical protein
LENNGLGINARDFQYKGNSITPYQNLFHTHVYGYELQLMQPVTDYMHQVFNYYYYYNNNNNNNNNSDGKELDGNLRTCSIEITSMSKSIKREKFV